MTPQFFKKNNSFNAMQMHGTIISHQIRPRAGTGMRGESRAVSLRSIVSENTNQFCRQSTLHGLKYVVDEQLYPMERIFFALSFVAVVLIAAFFISNVYAKWRSTPVIVGINPAPSYIENNPFPAVTICNLNQASKQRVAKYSQNSEEFTMLQFLCRRDINMKTVPDINWSSFEEFILNISQPCNEMLVSCRYGAVDFNCSEVFRPIVTDEGLCCVFNMVSPNFIYAKRVPNVRNISYTEDAVAINWDPQHGYPSQLPKKFYPRKSVGTGESIGLTLQLDANVDDYYCSSSTSFGFKAALHSPIEKPHVREIGNLLAPGMETKINIRTDKSEAARNLRSIERKYRRCLFEGEAKLVYFSYYNRRNCEIECKARQLLQYCGCIAHYMPLVESNPRICGIVDDECVSNVLHYKLSITNEEAHDCQRLCWPSCFDVSFITEFVVAPITHAGFTVSNHLIKNITSDNEEKSKAVVHFYFQDNIFRTTKQTEFIGITDFLSSVGGLMGLFMGFSFISIAEFFYYAVMRPYHILKQHTRFSNHNSSLNGARNNYNGPGHIIQPTPLVLPNLRQRYRNPSKLQHFPIQFGYNGAITTNNFNEKFNRNVFMSK